MTYLSDTGCLEIQGASLLISLLSACTRENSLKDTQNKRSGESQAIVDARQFFSEHPEYISSAELEQKLYREFAQVTTVPAYKEMSMYQLLVISQDRLTH
ncbi:invasion protein [Escherichia coli]|uniref:invasion protein n=1 Tax=Escherichia coli TaxID=562 RepID=UPI003570A16E